MRMLSHAAGAAALILCLRAATALAQIDYRNLDDDRPTLTEDAYPVERHAFEFLLPYRFEREPGGGRVHAWIPEIEYGFARNAQIGLKAPVAIARENGVTDWGLSGLKVFALYNFNTESRMLPALSLRGDATFGVGSLGGSESRVSLKAIATRSWGRSRLHLNGAYTLGREGTAPVTEAANRWWAGAAIDRTLFRHSTLLVGEVYLLQSTRGALVQVNASLGLRRQWTPTTVIDLGLTRRLRAGVGPDLALTIGFSHAFAFAWLMPANAAK